MRMRWPVVAAGWVAAAALATAASVGAVGTLRGLFGPGDAPMLESDVEAQLTGPPTTPSPSASGPSSSAATVPGASGPPATKRALSTDGGSLIASCTGGLAYIESYIPKSGYEVDHLARGPAATTALRFKARSGGGSVRLQVTCENGEPTLRYGGDD
ncbi:hypothetical protein [Dactylosporangium matsuzakiense]|nr:hypothetical protein [Dactylosporangium matsuzakiense]UWZ46979.1 hypothetical protein Dmats_11570 [Dactylosporangium matsuzakiense]